MNEEERPETCEKCNAPVVWCTCGMHSIFAGEDLKAGDKVAIADWEWMLIKLRSGQIPLGTIRRNVEESAIVWIEGDIQMTDEEELDWSRVSERRPIMFGARGITLGRINSFLEEIGFLLVVSVAYSNDAHPTRLWIERKSSYLKRTSEL